jgi:hypothetical protein
LRSSSLLATSRSVRERDQKFFVKYVRLMQISEGAALD